jgi:hypothetical protein
VAKKTMPFITRGLSVALVLVATTSPAEASLSVIAFDDDLERALVRFEDPNQGVMVQIRELQTGKVKKSWFVDDRNAEKKRVKRLTRVKFPVVAKTGQIDPKGRYTVIGAPDGRRSYNIMVLRDGRVGILGKVPLKKGANDSYAEAMLKEVVWAPGGKQIIVVVNQQYEQEHGKVEADDLHWFRFRQWKVKWLKPEPETSDETENE